MDVAAHAAVAVAVDERGGGGHGADDAGVDGADLEGGVDDGPVQEPIVDAGHMGCSDTVTVSRSLLFMSL